MTATATASANTDLFQPGVDVTKSCTPDPIEVGEVETCTIVVTNTGSPDSPDLENGTIEDTLTGDLLDADEPRGRIQRLHPGPADRRDLHDHHDAGGVGHRSQPAREHGHRALQPDRVPERHHRPRATASVTIVERPEPAITIEKKASHFSKVGDELDNLYEICNVGPIAVMRVSVIDELLGDITLSFAESLAPTECTEAHLMYTVQPGDPDPLDTQRHRDLLGGWVDSHGVG